MPERSVPAQLLGLGIRRPSGSIPASMAACRVLALSALASTCAGLAQKKDDVLVTHNLTICNGYADRKPLSVYAMTNKAKLTENPLEYKVCKLISLEMGEGERLDFKLGGLSVGTFRAAGLPYTPSNLLLVPFHKDTKTMSAAFASHAFSSLEGSQERKLDAAANTRHPGSRCITLGALEVSVGPQEPLRIFVECLSMDRYVVMRVGSEADGHEEDLVLSAATGSDFAREPGALESLEFLERVSYSPDAENEDGSGSLRSGLGAVALLAAAVAALAAA
ncbi:unnamed protein product [Prorocentrum cordatum]|uniref:Uncharacterized protein n=1 Tax=Prorocentrum cordatum TaxID=2364126 RepID=A0ABN9QK30_9DINO|nr:unnamed protein product [Polarella glacialis]